ncbi:cobalt/nickel transport system permease protein [Caloramator quimbayensis]|uniref:Cobalt/nickel transport system permease protein n=1 Tax=Caloramator quimbayensis TaxID=1147123 RepID=A0A1T4WGE7_9CLOT|nr:energy-coupling factor transporter transmembrane component T [Caloramator quimbayensis]SKA76372.1 cobalt/nickel transport system permease protein [Caloramator quimbayensis]
MDWLFKEDDFTPKKDKDTFADKTVKALLSAASNIRRQDFIEKKGFLYSVNPALKLLSVFVLIFFISLSKNIFFLLSLDSLLIICTLLLKNSSGKVLYFSFAAFAFSLLMVFPSVFIYKSFSSLIIPVKVFADIVIVNILSITTRWKDITKSLKLIYVPDIFIFILDIAIIYIYVLGDLALNMIYALKIRTIGKLDKKYSLLSNIIGNVFIQSKLMSDEMYSAMELRGFTGEYKREVNFKLNIYDFIFILVIIFMISSYFFF